MFRYPKRHACTHEGNIIIPQRKPRKDKIERLIEHLHVDPRLPRERMFTPIDVPEFDDRVNRSKERAVQPSTTLRDQLGNLVGHVRNGVRGLDVVQGPCGTALRDQFPAENTIFGEVHIRCEDICVGTVLEAAYQTMPTERLKAEYLPSSRPRNTSAMAPPQQHRSATRCNDKQRKHREAH